MDTILAGLLSWQFLSFCLAIGAVVFVTRLLVEYGMDNWWPLKAWKAAHKDAKLWRELILPTLPILLGVSFSLKIEEYAYPTGFTTMSGRLIFGLVAGFTSGLIVRLYRSFLTSKISGFTQQIVVTRTQKDDCSNVTLSATETGTPPANQSIVEAIESVVDPMDKV